MDNRSVRTLFIPNRVDLGGTRVDALFTSLLADIVGKDVMDAFALKYKCDFCQLRRDFAIMKRTINPELNEKVIFRVPISLLYTYSEMNPERRITDVLSNSKYKDKLTWKYDKIRMNTELIKTLFDEICKQIVDNMKKLFLYPVVKNVASILLVGGFSESLILQAAIREAFRNKNVIVPKEAGLAVLKGAILCGHESEKTSGKV